MHHVHHISHCIVFNALDKIQLMAYETVYIIRRDCAKKIRCTQIAGHLGPGNYKQRVTVLHGQQEAEEKTVVTNTLENIDENWLRLSGQVGC